MYTYIHTYTVHGVTKKSNMTEQLNTHTYLCMHVYTHVCIFFGHTTWLVCSWLVGPTRNEPSLPAMRTRNLNQWTSMEFPMRCHI